MYISAPATDITTTEAYFNQPDSSIDIGMAALLVSRDVNSHINIKGHLNRVDQVADAIGHGIDGTSDAEKIIEMMNRHIYADNEIQYRTNRHFINDVFDHREGNCLAFTCLYLAVGQRLGLPLEAVSVSGHVFVRYRDSHATLNIETTARGQIRDDAFYEQMITQSPGSPLSKVKGLRVLSTHQLLCKLLFARGLVYREQGQWAKARDDFNQAIALDPDYPGVYNNRGSIYAESGQYHQAITDFSRAIELDPHYAEAYNNRGLAYAHLQDNANAIRDWTVGAQLTRIGK